MDYSQALGNFGFKYTLNWRGKDYLFSFMSDRQRSWFETWLKQSEIEEIETNEYITSAERLEMKERFIRNVKNGVFRFGADRYVEAMGTPEGRNRFVLMLLVENHPELRTSDIEAMGREKRRELTAIVTLIDVESSVELTQVTPKDKSILLERVYGRFALPEDQGGLGMSIEEVSWLTDKQKIALVDESRRRTDPDAEAKEKRQPYSAEESAKIDNLLRQHELVK